MIILKRWDAIKVMKYIRVKVSRDSKVTGSRSGGAAVEIKERESYKNNDKKYYNDFFKLNRQNRNRTYLNSFEILDTTNVNKITYFPTEKNIKEIDVISYQPYEIGYLMIINVKVLNIFNQFNLPEYNNLPVKIKNFQENYFLIGLPFIQKAEVDLFKSIFYDLELKQEVKFKSYEKYMEVNLDICAKEIFLRNAYDYDIINLQSEGLFFFR